MIFLMYKFFKFIIIISNKIIIINLQELNKYIKKVLLKCQMKFHLKKFSSYFFPYVCTNFCFIFGTKRNKKRIKLIKENMTKINEKINNIEFIIK